MRNKKQTKRNTSAHSPVGLHYAADKLGIKVVTLLHCIERGDFQCDRDEDGNIVEVYLPGKEPQATKVVVDVDVDVEPDVDVDVEDEAGE